MTPKAVPVSRNRRNTKPHGGPHFLVRVHDDTGLLVVAKTNRNGEAQLAFLGLVELTALEARVQKM